MPLPRKDNTKPTDIPTGPRTSPPASSNAKPTPGSTTPSPGATTSPDAAQRAAEARATARENELRRKAGKRYLEQAANLEAQAKALRYALYTSFAKSRDQNLADISKALTEQFDLLKEGHGKRAAEFLTSARDTEKATSDKSQENISNAVRERQDSMTAVLEQGAGETDALKVMVLAARNWHANQSDVNRAYFDTMQSINQGIVDLNVDTKTALVNAATASEAERERIWQDFYNRRSEAFTQLGNIRGQQRDYYAQAKEMGVKPESGAEKAAKESSEESFMRAAKEAGKSYEQKDLPKWVADYTGTSQVRRRQTNTQLHAAMEWAPVEKAEGATLRKWAA